MFGYAAHIVPALFTGVAGDLRRCLFDIRCARRCRSPLAFTFIFLPFHTLRYVFSMRTVRFCILF